MKKLLIALLLLVSTTAMAELDLKLKGMGYRWVQDLESGKNNSAMRVFGQIGVTENLDAKIGWNRLGISSPLDNGRDNVMFEVFYKFD